MKRFWLTAVAALGVWCTVATFPLLFATSPWHLLFGALLWLTFACGTYKAIRSAYKEWTKVGGAVIGGAETQRIK